MAPFFNNKLLSTFMKKKIGMYTHIKTHTHKKNQKYVKYCAPEEKLL